MIVEYQKGLYALEEEHFELKSQEQLLKEMEQSGDWDELLQILKREI